MISTNTPTDHPFYVLSRNYWEAQGAIWGPMRQDLTGDVNETRIGIYSWIYLFGWIGVFWRVRGREGGGAAWREGAGSGAEEPPVKGPR